MILSTSACSSRTNRESGALLNGECLYQSTLLLSCAKPSSRLKKCLTPCHQLARPPADRAPRRLLSNAPEGTPRCAPLLSAPYFSLDTSGGKLLETKHP